MNFIEKSTDVFRSRQIAMEKVNQYDREMDALVGSRLRNMRDNISRTVKSMNEKRYSKPVSNMVIPPEFSWAFNFSKFSIESFLLGMDSVLIAFVGHESVSPKEQVFIPVAWFQMSDRELCKMVRDTMRAALQADEIQKAKDALLSFDEEIGAAKERFRKTSDENRQKLEKDLTEIKSYRSRAQRHLDQLIADDQLSKNSES